VIKLDADYVQFVHDRLVPIWWPEDESPPKGGCRDRGLLESAVNRPFQSAFGRDAYPDLTVKAAALFHSLVANHCFVDGNKRTAVITLNEFLLSNGYVLALGNDRAYELARETASHRGRGISAEAALSEIIQTIRPKMISFARLRSMAAKSPALRDVYQIYRGSPQSIKAVLKSGAKLRRAGVDPADIE